MKGGVILNPILLEVPLQLETERLILRAPAQTGDGAIVNEAIIDSFPELKRWLPFAQQIPSIEETEINLREAYIKFIKRDSFRFLIFTKNTGQFVGVTSIQSISWDIPKCEIGYWINTKYSGNGYMVEAVRELMNFGLHQLEFKRIEIRCESTNEKSRAIPEKLSFELEGILKNDEFSADGSKLTDTCVYAIF